MTRAPIHPASKRVSVFTNVAGLCALSCYAPPFWFRARPTLSWYAGPSAVVSRPPHPFGMPAHPFWFSACPDRFWYASPSSLVLCPPRPLSVCWPIHFGFVPAPTVSRFAHQPVARLSAHLVYNHRFYVLCVCMVPDRYQSATMSN